MSITDAMSLAPASVALESTRDPRARIDVLVDAGSASIVDAEPGSGIVTALGTIGGADVVTFASDPSVQGGAMSAEGCTAIAAAYDLALHHGCPVIGIWHSGGARLTEGAASLNGVGRVFAAMTQASGRVPQLSVVLGPAAGGAAYGPALTDIVMLGPRGRIFVTGPDVVRSVTGEEVDQAGLGGPEPHSRRSGVVHLTTETDADALAQARRIAALLARPGQLGAAADRPLGGLLPDSARRAYDVHPLLTGLLDEPGVELHPRWAPNMTTTLGRFAGRTVGVLANNPLRLGGCLDAPSGEKAARFVRMCDSFGVPLIVVVDTPGYLPGVRQEWDGVVRRGAKLLHAFAEASVPRITLITRKAYGGAYIAMNSASLGASAVLAWPTAQIAVMGPVAAVRVLHRRRLAGLPDGEREKVEAELAAEHTRASGGIARAIELGVVDDVVTPDGTRSRLATELGRHPSVRGTHGNIPL